ncbi:uncharacterized protein [Panulirus ornatus]|uniref:uncharacterized protein n=1 Tax=Panulirus ornatus TaxID=150431 RepID=UPI003A8519B4
MKPRDRSRMLWLMVALVWSVGDVTARESRKEANLLPVPVGVNLLDGATTEYHDRTQQDQHREEEEDDGPIVIDYDYFLHGSDQVDDHDPYFSLDRMYHHSPKADIPRDAYSLGPTSIDDIPVVPDYNYQSDHHGYNSGQSDHDKGYHKYKNPTHASPGPQQRPGDPMHDPFSVFYDSLFPEMDSVIPMEETEMVNENSRRGRPPSTTASRRTTAVHVSHHVPTTSPRRSSPPVTHTPTQPTVSPHSFNLTNSSQLQMMMPAFLENFGLPESFVNQLFQNESVLGKALIQMAQDETFREAMSIIPELDLSSVDLASLPRLFDKLDSSLVTTILQGTDLTRVTDLIHSLGLDTSYLKGVFSRAGAAGQYKNQDGDGDKSLYLPLLDTDSVTTVQYLGFVVIMVFLLTTAYAYLEYDIFDTAKTDKHLASRTQILSQHATTDWAQAGHNWLPAVDAAEFSHNKWQGQWHRSRPFYQEPLPYDAASRPTPPHRVPRPGPSRPEAGHYQLRQDRPVPPGLLTQESQNHHHHLTQQQPTVVPYVSAEHVDRRHYSSYEDDQLYHDQHSYEDGYYSEDYYYEEPSQDSDASFMRHVPNPQHYVTTPGPEDVDSFYTYYAPRHTPSTRRPQTRTTPSTATTRKRVVTTTPTTSPPTRPTSKYVGTIRSPQYKSSRARPTRPTTTPH